MRVYRSRVVNDVRSPGAYASMYVSSSSADVRAWENKQSAAYRCHVASALLGGSGEEIAEPEFLFEEIDVATVTEV